MSTIDYTRFASTALSLLTKFGATVTITRNQSTINPITGQTQSGVSGGPYYVVGVLTNYDDKDIDGTSIKAGDRKLILDSSAAPLKDDLLSMDSENLGKIVSIKTVKPAATVICYILQMRK